MNYRLRLIMLGLMDAYIIALAVIMAYFLRFEFKINANYFAIIPYTIAGHIIINLIAFHWAKIYRRVWQYASIGEVISLIRAVTISEILFYLINTIIQKNLIKFVLPRSIYILSMIFIILGVGGSRFIWRIYRDNYNKIKPYHQPTLIIGAGQAGAMIAKELKHSSCSELYPLAFIDDDKNKHHLEVMGLPVLGGREKITDAIKELDIRNVIIAIPSLPASEKAKIIDICKVNKVNIKTLPRVIDLISNKLSIKMIREVNVEDLLGREPVEIDMDGIADYVTNKVVLVTGAGGSIGSELCRQIIPFAPQKLLLLGHGENSIYDIEQELKYNFPQANVEAIIADVQDRIRIREVFELHHPTVVFHSAAHKHVPLMEKNPTEAVKNNILGTKNVADSAHEFGASHFVMISTDKAVNPTSVMGATKRVAVMYVQGLNKISPTKFVAVRFGNVLGSRGSVIPLFMSQIQGGGPITITHPDMVRYFMTIKEATQLVIQAGALAQGGEIFILDMGQPVKILDLAKDLIRISGYEPDRDIKIVYTGIRPGEKLYEEILTHVEGTKATKHDRIFVGKPEEFYFEEIEFIIKKLEQAVHRKGVTNRSKVIKRLIQHIVPSYQESKDVNIKTINVDYRNLSVKREMAATKDDDH